MPCFNLGKTHPTVTNRCNDGTLLRKKGVMKGDCCDAGRNKKLKNFFCGLSLSLTQVRYVWSVMVQW